MAKPRTTSRSLNSVKLSWENVFSGLKEESFILQWLTFCKEWKTLYRGSHKNYILDNLAPCSSYNMRLKNTEGDWIYFATATTSITVFAFHLTQAVKFNNIPLIRKIVITRPNLLNTENKEGKTPLIQAVQGGNLQTVNFLLTLGANVNQSTIITLQTPLMIAIGFGHLQIAQILIDKSADCSLKDLIGRTILHYAVDSNILANLEFCLSLNLNIDAQDNKGWTPLLRAVLLECSDEIIQLLLKTKAKKTVKDNYGLDFDKHLQLNKRIVKGYTKVNGN